MASQPASLPTSVPLARTGLLPRLAPFGLAGLAGALSILSFPGYGVWPLAFVSLVPLLYVLEDTTPRRALALGCFAGFIANAAGFYWLVGTVRDFGELPMPIALAAYLTMSAANGLGWGVFSWLMRVARGRDGRSPWWLAPVAFTAVEFAWWSVFPAYFGAGLWKATILAQGAELAGIVGLSFLLVLMNAAIFDALRATRRLSTDWRRSVAIAIVALAAWTGFGAWRLARIDALSAAAPTLKIGMAQSNIGAFTKRRAGQGEISAARDEVTTYQQMSRELEAQGIELLMWPETAYPFRLPLGTTNAKQATGPVAIPAVIGAVTDQPHGAMHNSAVLLDRGGNILGQSHKIHMVPFGEYLPFGDRFPKLYELIPAISHLQPGDAPHPLVLPDGANTWRFGSLICYEDILPGYTREVVRATDPDIILNLTNDSWYGDSIEPTIHLALATFRSIEHRRSLVRSTNTGRSALIDPAGRVILESGQHTKETLVGTVPVIRGVTTVYRVLGDWLGWICVAISLGLAFVRRRERNRAAPGGA